MRQVNVSLSCAALLAALLAMAPLAATAGSLQASYHGAPSLEHRCLENEQLGVKSAAVKKAARKLAEMLRSGNVGDVLDWFEKKAGLRIMRVVKKHARSIADTLETLCKWEELTLTMVEAQLAGVLYDVGVPRSTARTVAFWLKQFISWTLL